MELTAQLVQGESGRRVVEVRAYQGGRLLGSALGEAADAEAAEDRARQRLLARLDPAAISPAQSLAPDQSLVHAQAAPGGGHEPAAREPRADTDASPAPEHSAGSLPARGSDRSGTNHANSPGRPTRQQQDGSAIVSAGAVRDTVGGAVGGSIKGSIGAEPVEHQNADIRPNPVVRQPQVLRMNLASDHNDSAVQRLVSAEESTPAEITITGQKQAAGSVPTAAINQAAGPEDSEGYNQATGIEPGLGPGLQESRDHPAGTDHPEASASAATSDSPRRSAEAVASQQAPTPAQEPPTDPEDWSSDLAALELQLRRLGWDREREAIYLQRAFGHPSRNRLTNYSDLRAYLHTLDHLVAGSEPATAAVPLRRSELLRQCDALLSQLGWNAEQGRALLERELQVASRQLLNDQQLLHFNMLLESEMLRSDRIAPAPGQTTVVP